MRIIAIIVAFLLIFAGAATCDSCNRHDRNCFGITGTK